MLYICLLNNLELTVSQSEQTEHKDGGNCEDFHVGFLLGLFYEDRSRTDAEIVKSKCLYSWL